jgi:hypothetical protein
MGRQLFIEHLDSQRNQQDHCDATQSNHIVEGLTENPNKEIDSAGIVNHAEPKYEHTRGIIMKNTAEQGPSRPHQHQPVQ